MDLKNARVLMEKIKAGQCDYTFIEIMGCHQLDALAAASRL